MSTKFVRIELPEEALLKLKYYDIILNSMIQTKEKWDYHVDLAFEWYEDFMISCVFIFFFFLFRTNVKREFLNENDFRHSYSDF